MGKICCLGIAAIFAAALVIGVAAGDYSAWSTPDGSVDPVELEITIESGCDSLPLIRGETTECQDIIYVTANADWKLSVEDDSSIIPFRGYMNDGPVKSVNEQGTNGYKKLTNPFVLEGIGDLCSGPVMIEPLGKAPASSQPVVVPYSQQVAGNEKGGDYYIMLTYTISPR